MFVKILPPPCRLSVSGESTFNVGSGNINHSQSLFAARGGALPIGVTLSYQSLADFDGTLGQSWSHNYDMALVKDGEGNVFFRKGLSGKGYLYDSLADIYMAQTADTSTLTKDEGDPADPNDDIYLITERDGRKYRFDATGRITAVEDRFGNALVFTYPDPTQTVIADPANRSITLYDDDSDGRIDRITDPGGSVWDITYHPGTDLLWQVIAPAPKVGAERPTWTYTYDAGGFLETKTDPENHTVTYIYDAAHRIQTSLDPEDQSKSLVYDPATKTTTLTEKDGGLWTYVYGSGGLLSKTDPAGNTTSYTYFADGRTLSQTVPGHSTDPAVRYTTFYTYDAYGNKLTETVPVDTVATYGMAPEAITDPSTLNPVPQVAFRYSYDYAHEDRIASITDERGAVPLTTSYVYTNEVDPVDPAIVYEVTTVTDPADHQTVTRTYADGRLKDTTDANSRTVSFDYHTDGQLWKVSDNATGIVTEYLDYDPLGNAQTVKVKEPGGGEKIAALEYDALSRPIRSTVVGSELDPQGNPVSYVTEYGYDKNSNRNYVLDAEHAGDPAKATTYQHNYKGQVTSVIDALGNKTVLEYQGAGCPSCGGGGAGKLTGVIDANHVNDPEPRTKTAFAYYQTGNLKSETDPLNNTILYTYYPSGRLHQKLKDVNGDGVVDAGDQVLLSYTYHPDGQLESKTDHLSGETTTFTYDANRRLETAANPHIGYTFDYYANGWLKSVTDTTSGRTITYDQYDGVGQRKQVTLLAGSPDQQVLTYGYDVKGRLETIASAAAGTFTFGYDDLSRRGSLTYPNGVVAAYGYHPDMGWLTGLTYQGTGGVSLLEVGYPTHDKVGNRKDKLQDGVVTSYGYDDLYQLLNATTGASQENFTYDAVGNRTSGPTVKEPPGAYQHDDANRMLDGRRFTYAYDALGNQTSRLMGPGKEWVQSWDGENRLIKAELKKGTDILRTVSFKYDPFGRRIEKRTVDAFGAETVTTTHVYVYDGEDIVFEYKTVQVGVNAPITTMTHYVHGPGIDEPLAMVRGGQSYFYHADGLGSIVAITDGAQNVVQRYSYDAFGMVTPQDPDFENAYTYTGREWDAEIGLYFYRARYYDPMEGRFISKDPIGFAGGDVNLYGYVQNNSINLSDPFGLLVLGLTGTASFGLGTVAEGGMGAVVDTNGNVKVLGNVNGSLGPQASFDEKIIVNPSLSLLLAPLAKNVDDLNGFSIDVHLRVLRDITISIPINPNAKSIIEFFNFKNFLLSIDITPSEFNLGVSLGLGYTKIFDFNCP